ncbi:MAG TPA: hypothetical protein VFQ68_29665 [Streptosporangiaceae bacterium]|nr:hypothetical protein [Streptosporangiaceae bacterium]
MQAIEARTGPITGVRIVSAGQNSPLAAVIDARDGTVFAKGLPSAHRRVITQAREAAVAPLVKEISPALLWHFDEAGWNVLGYQYAAGRHADYSPGSADLDRLVQFMDTLSAIKVPDDPGPFKRAEDRWKPYHDAPETAAVLAGPILTHSDWTPDNVLVSDRRAWLIDWAWPTLGAAWTDPACWVLRLMACGGHTAHEAERQASRLPAFQAADPAYVDLFAAANVRLWDEIARSSTSDWTTKMAQAAKSWAAYRQAPLSLRTTRRPATPARLPARRHIGGYGQRVPSGQVDPLLNRFLCPDCQAGETRLC